jgi:hypothetical protein
MNLHGRGFGVIRTGRQSFSSMTGWQKIQFHKTAEIYHIKKKEENDVAGKTIWSNRIGFGDFDVPVFISGSRTD